ncbi:hypothetical protein BSL78_12620 [Apostichopus japonicus]|uniref:Uncharacterized protein n=1 Tax=Stichopus japonicus TaxID=307972 RepID=A0A2G8KR57_STIJA|nr:hypothetical protein BSL78_12620 [Apostichopus japonicus]
MRTKEAYELQAVAVQTNPALFTLYGIKQSSCLNELQFFHVVEGSPPDIAHDLFEGVIPEVIAEVVKYCVTQQFFTLSDLNEQIKKFPYEGSDCTNKPSLMSDKIQTFKVKQTACQALCLCRLLPLMVGSFIPQDSKEWQVLLKLLDVVQYCMSKKVTRALTIFLADLIEEFLTMYFEAFPHVSMKPKAHYLVHYPEMLLQYGPLINTWTLRFEGKHNYFKETARTSKNRKNVCKTLATRHEYMQATYHGSQNFLTEDALTHSKGDLYPVRLLPQTIQAQVLLLVGGNESVYSVGKVCYNGSFYSKGLAVAVEEGSFGKIDMCFLITDEVFLLCRMSERVQYISHVHAFNKESDNFLKKFSQFCEGILFENINASSIKICPYDLQCHKFLLIFGPNNKKVEIESNDVGASKSELHAAAVKTFGLGGSELILQLYDRDFSDYVDIEDGELFYGPAKLRVVKGQEQPATFPVTINNAEDSINAEISDSGSTVSQLDYTAGSDFLRDNSDFSLLTPNSPSPPPTPNAYSTPVSIEQPSTSSSADDPPSLPAAPLTSSLVSPHPTSPVSFHSGWITKFQIPVQPPTIESKLKSGGYTMNVAERSLFLDSIYKEVTEKYGIYYPSKAQYDEIITKLFVKYPSMKTPQDNMPVGNLKMLWKHRLQYKFQNFRKRVAFEIAAVQKKKLKVARKPKSAPESPAAPPQWGMKNYLPNRPETEDDASIDGHICWLQDEKRKRQPDFRGVSQSMALTLADRRTWIISSPQTPSLADIKSKYPWLFDDIQDLNSVAPCINLEFVKSWSECKMSAKGISFEATTSSDMEAADVGHAEMDEIPVCTLESATDNATGATVGKSSSERSETGDLSEVGNAGGILTSNKVGQSLFT